MNEFIVRELIGGLWWEVCAFPSRDKASNNGFGVFSELIFKNNITISILNRVVLLSLIPDL